MSGLCQRVVHAKNQNTALRPPCFFLSFVAANVPLFETFRKVLEDTIFTTIVTALTFVEDTHQVDLCFDACLVGSVKAAVKDTV